MIGLSVKEKQIGELIMLHRATHVLSPTMEWLARHTGRERQTAYGHCIRMEAKGYLAYEDSKFVPTDKLIEVFKTY